MLSRKLLTLLRYTRKLWVRVVLIALLSLLAALLAPLLSPLLPTWLVDRLDRDAVMPVLTIIASSMLAVTTFSLNVMVGAYRAAQAQATPRSYRVLLEDTTTHNALATFTGAFIFSLTAIILFRARVYDAAASVTVFGATIVVVVLIIVAILRWIEHLTQLGSMDHTLETLDVRTRRVLSDHATAPHMGGRPPAPTLPEGAAEVRAPRAGYLQIVDMAGLQERADRNDTRVHVRALPGAHVMQDDVLALVENCDDDQAKAAQVHFTIGNSRTFEQDARYGLIVLSEIASRALSSGINDPGTAIDVIDRLQRLLWARPTRDDPEEEPPCPRVHIAALEPGALLEAAYRPLTLDAAARPDVSLRLVNALAAFARDGQPDDRVPARALARLARDHAEAALVLEAEKAPIREACPE